MQTGKNSESGAEAPEVVVVGADIPMYVLSRRFKKYLFFDADIGSSDALISAVQLVAKTCFGLNSKIRVFSSSDRELLGYLNSTDDWPVKLKKISKVMRSSGDCGGLILEEATQKWAVYQNRPVDVGVFAFDCDQGLQDIAAVVDDCFFDCGHIARWLSGEGEREINLVDGFGRDFLITLIKNYS
jgi:hypothetical protein